MSPTSFQTAPPRDKKNKMGGDGFEPSKHYAADLQSVPFGHSGIHPFIAFWQLLALSKKPMIGLEPITC